MAAAAVLLVALTSCSTGGGAPAPAETGPSIPAPAASIPAPAASASPSASASTVAEPATPVPGKARAAVAGAVAGYWPTFGRTRARSSHLTGMPVANKAGLAFTARLDGAVYAQPLLVGGRLLVATENNSIYALNAASGAVIWRTHLGAPVSRSTLPCGNIDPLGITGTPVYDPYTKWVYAVTETAGARHTLVAVDGATGAVKLRRNVDPKAAGFTSSVDPTPYQQRAALLRVGRTIYVTYGGLAGDCGPYIGTVLGVPDQGSGRISGWRPGTPREGGMWNPAGPALAPNGHLVVPVGNGQVTSGRFDGSDSLTELSTALKRISYFAPAQWGNDNAGDQDLSSGSPAVVTVGSATWAVIVGKAGVAYLVKIGAMGGIGGERAAVNVGCRSLGTSATYGTTVIQNCGISGQVMAFTVGNGTLTRRWSVTQDAWGAATGGGRVFLVTKGGALQLRTVASGRLVTSVGLGDSVPHFVVPMLTKSSAYVGTDHGVVRVRLAS